MCVCVCVCHVVSAQALPSDIGCLQSLEVLDISNNQLTCIPSELGKGCVCVCVFVFVAYRAYIGGTSAPQGCVCVCVCVCVVQMLGSSEVTDVASV